MRGVLVVLDIGSTLVQDPPRGPGSRLADAVGLDVPEKGLLTRALMTADMVDSEAAYDLVRKRFGRSGDSVRAAVREIWDAQEVEASPIPGAAEVLERFATSGHRLALLSNIWTPYLRSVRKHFGEFFDAHIPRNCSCSRAAKASPNQLPSCSTGCPGAPG